MAAVFITLSFMFYGRHRSSSHGVVGRGWVREFPSKDDVLLVYLGHERLEFWACSKKEDLNF